MLLQGQTHHSPRPGNSQAHPPIHPLDPLNTAVAFQPLPKPIGLPPYHIDLETLLPGITAEAAQLGHLTFHCVGDTGGIKSPLFQMSVANALKADLTLPPATVPRFFYHLGDVVYYNGQIPDYYDQFYEPYDHYTNPIISIPGNHDGDPTDATQTSLDGWVRYFMQPTPVVQPESHDAPRVTLSLPNVYFTLNCPFATIVGMYTNVPEGGSIDSVQQQWLTNELATAPTNKALLLALHHPIYSFDIYHSGSPAMALAVTNAINISRRVPNMILTAHVHDYQLIERTLVAPHATPFLVAGNGGYYNLHTISTPVGTTDPATGARLVEADDQHHGYLTLTIDTKSITCIPTLVPNPSTPTVKPTQPKPFTYPATAVQLAKGKSITL